MYELPASLPPIASMSAVEERGVCVLPSNHVSKQPSTPVHHGDLQQQQQQWGLAQIQRGLTR